MIPANDTKATSGYTGNGVEFSIDEDDMAFIFGILRNNMYSNPIKICVQEPLCNGRDAARAIGNVARPMEVELPSCEFEYFTVRDFGASLTYEQMVNVFCKYGKSTKRGTNETGGFGIGAKSPWAYNNEFFVDTFIDNTKTSYRFYIDDETERGKMEVISTSKVETENGLKVIIPVKEGDRQEFINSFEFVTRYWGVKPIVTNDVYVDYIDNEVDIEDDWILYKEKGAYSWAAILVDDIPYPIDLNAIELPENLKEFSKLPIHFFCGPDDVNVAASREQLNYTKKTTEFLLSEFQRAYDTCNEYISSDIQNHSKLTEAYEEWASLKNSKWRKILTPKWNGVSLNIKKNLENIPHLCNWRDGNEDTKIFSVSLESYNTNGLYVDESSSLIITRPILVIPSTSKRLPYARVRRAIEQLKEKNGTEMITCIHLPCIEEREEEVWKHLKEKCHWDLLEVYNLGDFKTARKEKGQSKCKGNVSELRLGSPNLVKMFLDVSDIEGYYCEGKYNGIDVFNNGDFVNVKDTYTLNNVIRKRLGIEKIYVIPKKHLKDAAENTKLMLLSDVIELNKKVYDKKKCDRIARQIQENFEEKNASNIYRYLSDIICKNIDKLNPNGDICKFFETYVSTTSVSTEDQSYYNDMRVLYDYNPPVNNKIDSEDKSVMIEEEKKNIRRKYTLLNRLDSYYTRNDPNFIEHVIMYINAVDALG